MNILSYGFSLLHNYLNPLVVDIEADIILINAIKVHVHPYRCINYYELDHKIKEHHG